MLPADFPFESEAQRKSVGAFDLWRRSLPASVVDRCTESGLVLAFLAQKNHEAQLWWSETMGDQISAVTNQVRLCR